MNKCCCCVVVVVVVDDDDDDENDDEFLPLWDSVKTVGILRDQLQ